MESKVYGMLGLATRAGKITFGTEASLESIESLKAKLVIIAQDTSDNTKDKIIRKCENKNIEYILFGNIFANSKACGKVNKAIMTITDDGFAKSIINILNKE